MSGQKSSRSLLKTVDNSNNIGNIIEISENEDIDIEDDNVEYVEYSEEDDLMDYMVVEEVEEDSNQEIVAEELPKKNYRDEYHCSSCNTNFESVEKHIKEFHKNEEIVVQEEDDSEAGCKPEERIKVEDRNEVQVKVEEPDEWIEQTEYTIEEILDSENLQVADDIEYDLNGEGEDDENENAKVETILDQDGRLFIRNVTKRNRQQSGMSTGVSKAEPNETQVNFQFECSKCAESFDSMEKLDEHLQSDHKFGKQQKRSRKEIVKQPAVCEICNTSFPSNKSLRLHSRMHGTIKIKPIEELMAFEMKSTLKSTKNPQEMFFCEICKKSYDISFQEVHIKSHQGDPEFICTICNRKFANQLNLEMHLKAHQENPKQNPPTKAELTGTTLPYECAYCGRQFARPHEKVKHERIHTGEKPYKCEICGKCFRVSYCLTLHLRTHTTARPYVCPQCNKRFKGYSVYSHHLMTHSDERPYKCPHCPKAFKTSVQLAGHKNSHTKPFSCPECNRPFASLYTVKAHMETHKRQSQNFKHRCLICGAIYARVFALKDHMKEQHQTTLDYGNESTTEMNVVTEVPPFLTETETSTQSILPDTVEEITIGDMDHFQAEEVVTDWLK